MDIQSNSTTQTSCELERWSGESSYSLWGVVPFQDQDEEVTEQKDNVARRHLPHHPSCVGWVGAAAQWAHARPGPGQRFGQLMSGRPGPQQRDLLASGGGSAHP